MKLLVILAVALTASVTFAEPPPKPKGPPPGGKGGPGGESAEMKALLKSFNLTSDQQAKYDAAKKKTSEDMRKIHEGKVSGSLTMDEVLKQALASHKAFNAAVKDILTPEQYDKWLPVRESDHHKIAQAHKERDEAEAKKKADGDKKP
jgi:Spy/CpxP family protein refolding chaperone